MERVSDHSKDRHIAKDAHHLNVLGFTAANGNPIMCAIIFAAKTLEDEWGLGLDPFAEWVQKVPTRTSVHSLLWSQLCELLVGMLAHKDKAGIIAQDTAPPPFLILDGHGSRFDLLFLEYINDPEHNWNVCIGCALYRTSYWQVGDSTAQNSCYKMATTKAKREPFTKKEDHRQEFSLNKVDIVGIVSTAWDESFSQVTSNKTPIAIAN